MTQEQSKIILWLEDIPDTIERITHNLPEKYELEICDGIKSFADKLEDFKERISLIVLDIMIIGSRNLGAIGKPEILTGEGYDTGWKILEYYLREKNSEYKDIPVLITTVSSLSENHKKLIECLSKEGAKIDFVEKNRRGWYEDFNEKFKEIMMSE